MHTQLILKFIRVLTLNAKGYRDESAKNPRNKSMQYYMQHECVTSPYMFTSSPVIHRIAEVVLDLLAIRG